MSKKKKSGGYREWKIKKAQHKNQFFADVREMCSAVASPEIFAMIPKKKLAELYAMRNLPFHCRAEQNTAILPELLDTMRRLISGMMKSEHIALFDKGPEVSLVFYNTVAYPVILFLEGLEERSFPLAKKVKEALLPLSACEASIGRMQYKIRTALNITAILSSALDSTMYWLEHVKTAKSTGTIGIDNTVIVHPIQAERKTFSVEGAARSAVRVGVPVGERKGLLYAWLTSSELGMNKSNKLFEVYIQMHALHRFKERADCLQEYLTTYFVFESLTYKRLFTDDGGRIFFPVTVDNVTIGYFIAGLTNGVILIRTFLLATNSGTPEGKKLDQLFHINKLDKQYLAMDKLSSFATGELGANEAFRAAFREAGCEKLLDFHKRINFKGEPVKFLGADRVQFLLKYLGIERCAESSSAPEAEGFTAKTTDAITAVQ